jgi:hypothetical protein
MKALLVIWLAIGSIAFADDKQAIAEGCAELNRIGNITSIRTEIAQDMAEIKRLIQSQPAEKIKDRVMALGDQIKRDTDSLMQFVEPRFLEVNYEQDLEFSLGLSQLADGPTLNSYQNITRARLTEVYNFSSRAEEPLARAKLTFDSSHIRVQLRRPASLLEICQLPQAIMISVDLQVEALFSAEEVDYTIFTKDYL